MCFQIKALQWCLYCVGPETNKSLHVLHRRKHFNIRTAVIWGLRVWGLLWHTEGLLVTCNSDFQEACHCNRYELPGSKFPGTLRACAGPPTGGSRNLPTVSLTKQPSTEGSGSSHWEAVHRPRWLGCHKYRLPESRNYKRGWGTRGKFSKTEECMSS